jgi:hypothetical protein
MLAILLIYFVGKAFYDLAHEHGKNRWGFAILGVVSYYAGVLLTGIILALLTEFGVTDIFEGLSDFLIGLIAIPIGVLACWGLYKLLENNWENQPKGGSNDALDSGFTK